MAGWGIVDDILGAINLIDWFEGVFRGALAGDMMGHRIALPHPDSDWWQENQIQPWSLNQMRELLDSYHIATYRRGFNSEEIWIHVKRKQARWAEYVLHRAGAPVQMQTVDGRNVAWASSPKHGGKMPTRWADRPDTGRRSGRRGRARRRDVSMWF